MRIKPFSQQTLSRQFLIASFPIFLLSTLFIGYWVASKIENRIAYRQGGITALYVESFIAHHLQSAAGGGPLTEHDREALQSLMSATPLGRKIVSFKVWDLKGTILYSRNPELIGRSFPVGQSLKQAYAGELHSELSDLSDEENEIEHRAWGRLIETYVPIREVGSGRVIAVAEFYQTTEELERESWLAKLQSWAIIAATFLGIYLLLAGLVQRGSNTITRQRQELEQQIGLLTELVEQNSALHERVRRAAARTTALNENFLRRVSSDLHDGPGQDLGLALMQIRTLSDGCSTCPGLQHAPQSAPCSLQAVFSSLRSALDEIRAMSAGLRLPDIADLTVGEVVARAIRDYESKSNAAVSLQTPPSGAQQDAALPVKITLYRILQESLANGLRHAGGAGQAVSMKQDGDRLEVRISDAGKGFVPREVTGDRHLGLKGMRERVEILGGSFHIDSSARGTVIQVTLPLTVPGIDHE